MRFAGLALRAEILRETTIEITEGPRIEMERERVREEDPGSDIEKITSVTVDLSEMRSYLPSSENEWAASGAFQTVPENLERLPGPAGVEILKWDGTLHHRRRRFGFRDNPAKEEVPSTEADTVAG